MSNAPISLTIPGEDRFLVIKGQRCRYREVGQKGEPLLLIHGLGGSLEQWAMNIGALSSSHRVFCLDMPGCGRSDPMLSGDYSLVSLAGFVKAFIHEQSLGTVSLIGLSMGGAVCLRIALDFPDTVRKIVSVGGAGLGPRMAFPFRALTLPVIDAIPGILSRKQFSRFVRSMIYDPALVTDEITDFYYTHIKTNANRRAFLQTLKASCSFFGLRKSVRNGIIARLSDITHPMLIIWGRQDRHMPIRNAHEAVARLPSARLILFDRCRHNAQFEKAEEFNRVVMEFLVT